jgi:hypothetical protein
MAIKNLLRAEFLRVVPVSLLRPKDTICCRARDAVEYESGQSYWVPAIPAKAGRHIAYISCLKRKINIIQN